MTAACSPGSLLLRPSRLAGAQAAVDPDEALVRDLLDAFGRIAADKAMGGTILDVVEEAVEGSASRLLDGAGGGLTRAVEHLKDLARPLASFAQTIQDLVPDPLDASSVAAAAMTFLARLAGAASGLSIDRLRSTMATALSVLQDDLGLHTDAVLGHAWDLLDDMAARLQAVPEEPDGAVYVNRLNVIGLLRRIRRRMKDRFRFPDLDAERAAQALFDAIASRGTAEVLEKIACIGTNTSAGLTIAKDLTTLVPFTGMGSHSIGAGETPGGAGGGAAGNPADPELPPTQPDVEYLWYASWLLGSKDVKWYQLWRSSADFWIDRRSTSVQIRRRTQRLFLQDVFNWDAIPQGTDEVLAGTETGDDPALKYTFKHISADCMEAWARHTAWIADGLEGLFHIYHPLSGVTITKGGQLSVTDLLNMLLNSTQVTFDTWKKMPMGIWIQRDLGAGNHWYGGPLAFTPTFVANVAGTFQGWHGNADAGHALLWWLLLLICDVINAVGANALPQAVRNFLLSLFTLVNYDGEINAPVGSRDDRPDNRVETDGILAVFNLVAGILLVKLAVPREDYAQPFEGPGGHAAAMWAGYLLLGSIVMGVLAGFIGTAFAQALMAIAGSPATDWAVLGLNILKSMKAIGLYFWLTLYTFKENDTGGGTWNNAGGTPFNGYPDNADSPYLLPWKGGDTAMCFQGNQGLFSHHQLNNGQVYSYDMMIDHGDEVLAMRPGTVVDYFDWVPDYQNVQTTPAAPDPLPIAGQTQADNWNVVVIRHDQDAAPKHDLGPGGAAVVTYAVYGHGTKDSVRTVFGDRGVAPGAIIGTRVVQGQSIMLANSTGNSFCDHVHVAVHTGPAVPASDADKRTPVAQSMLGQEIPFVFKDVGRNAGISPTAGVPGSRTWHESGQGSGGSP